MRVLQVDPPAFTPPYDRALCAALARAGIDVSLLTSRFVYGELPPAEGFPVEERFYRWQPGRPHPASKRRRAARLIQHVPGMLGLRSRVRDADIVHFQWFTVQQIDHALLPGGPPLVITAHDVLPRVQIQPGQRGGQRKLYEKADAIVCHSEHSRARLVGEVGLPPEKITVAPHGAFTHLLGQPETAALPPELPDTGKPVVLQLGLMRPYKGIDVALAAWDEMNDAELWIAGRPRMDVQPLIDASPPGVRWVTRFLEESEIAALLRRADVVVLPYREIEQSGVLFAALAFGKPMVLTAVGGFPEIGEVGAADVVPPDDPGALRAALRHLLDSPADRERLAAGALAAAAGPFSWDRAAEVHVALYERLRGGTAGSREPGGGPPHEVRDHPRP